MYPTEVSSWIDELVAYAAGQVGERELEVLLGRGVSEAQIQRYRIGHLNEALPASAPKHFAEWARNKLDDVFVLPLTTTLGETRGLQLRHVDRAKSGYQDYFLPRREACLFGLAEAMDAMWQTRSVFLVEGAFDLFPVQRAVPNVVATLTARTAHQMVRVMRRTVKDVFLGYDMDPPGRAGCAQFQSRYGPEFRVHVVSWPAVNGDQVKDPGELWEAWGDAGLIPFVRGVVDTAGGLTNAQALRKC